jgi:hypothetical protein
MIGSTGTFTVDICWSVCYTTASQGIVHEFGTQFLAAAFHRRIAVHGSALPKAAFHCRKYEMLAAKSVSSGGSFGRAGGVQGAAWTLRVLFHKGHTRVRKTSQIIAP